MVFCSTRDILIRKHESTVVGFVASKCNPIATATVHGIGIFIGIYAAATDNAGPTYLLELDDTNHVRGDGCDSGAAVYT